MPSVVRKLKINFQVKCLFILFCCLSLTSPALAWGPEGHRIVGNIAQKYLNHKAAKKVKIILGKETLANSATWADEIRSNEDMLIMLAKMWKPKNYKHTDNKSLASLINSWHYITWPYNTPYKSLKREESGDILYAIDFLSQLLKTQAPQKPESRYALRLLAHFIGDLHQPLHVGNGNDRGGNSCWVNWEELSPAKNVTPEVSLTPNYQKLHYIWDISIIDNKKMSMNEYTNYLEAPNSYFLADTTKDVVPLAKKSNQEIASLYKTKVKSWMSGTPKDWAIESQKLHNVAYLNYNPSGKYKYCYEGKNGQVDQKNIPKITWMDRYEMQQTADRRVLQAGVRLAYTLNQIFK